MFGLPSEVVTPLIFVVLGAIGTYYFLEFITSLSDIPKKLSEINRTLVKIANRLEGAEPAEEEERSREE
ncbi:hypothetical protein HY491_02325 [Candidatus Woesearchaeota archaeon]|nr:hypothetical protein [Candidatus Woesearchaeota archaeon]